VQCEQVTQDLQLTCVVTELNAPNYDVILPIDVVDELNSMPAVNVLCMPVVCSPLAPSADDIGDYVDAVNTVTVTESNNDVCDVDCLEINETECDAKVMIVEQWNNASDYIDSQIIIDSVLIQYLSLIYLNQLCIL